MEGFAAVQAVHVEIYTAAYRISGTIHTPFRRVAEILNQLPSGHVAVDDATVEEFSAAEPLPPAASTLVAVDEILAMAAPGLAGEARAEMRIQKQPAWAVLSIPPLRLDGTVHVPVGTRAADGLLNVADRFLPMTDVRLSCAAYPSLDQEIPVLAVRRDRAHVMVVTEGAPVRSAPAAPEPA
jgi:hypothetical protein